MATDTFIWGQGGQKLTPAQAKARRETADALRRTAPTPTTFGEGLAAIGKALEGVAYDRSASAAEAEHGTQRKAIMDALMGNPDPTMADIYSALGNDVVSSDPTSTAIINAMMGDERQQASWAREDARYAQDVAREDSRFNQQRQWQLDDRNAGYTREDQLLANQNAREDRLLADEANRNKPVLDAQLTGANLANEAAALELETLRNPPAPGPEYEFVFAPDGTMIRTDTTSGTIDRLGAYPKPASGPMVTVNTGAQGPKLGSLSTDYGYISDPTTGEPIYDPATGLPTAAPVPGSPAAVEMERAAQQADIRNTQAANSADIVLGDIDRAMTQVSGWTAGAGSLLSNIPGTEAVNLASSLDTIKANIGFDRLQQMREASPTGGALGGIAVEELRMLQAVMGSLNTAQTPEQLSANLARLREIYEPIAAKAAAYPNASQFGFSGGGAPESQSSPDNIDDILKGYGL